MIKSVVHKNVLRYSCLVVTTTMLSSCAKNYIESQDEVSFKKDIIPIFEQSCIGCHNSSSTPPILLENSAYSELTDNGFINLSKPVNSLLLQKLASGHPSSGVPNDADYNKIRSWIEVGALND